MGRKLKGFAPLGESELCPHLTQCRLGRGLYPLSSGILIHPAVWTHWKWTADYTDAGKAVNFESGEAAVSLSVEGAGSPSNTVWPRPRPISLHAKFYLGPFNRLATIHQRHRQDRQTDRTTGEPFNKRSPKNGSPYAIGPLSVLFVCPIPSVCNVGVL